MTSIAEFVARGLTSDEAAERLAADGPNELPGDRGGNFLHQLWAVVSEPMLILLLVAGTINFLLAEPLDGSILLSTVIVVIVVSVYQERRTENALEALRDLSAPRALVMRDGERVRIAGRDVVRGDCLFLAEGDRIPADAVLLESLNLVVDESVLTGESVPVSKVAPELDGLDGIPEQGAPGGDDQPWLFSGTLVVKGQGTAHVMQTGSRTAFGAIGEAMAGIEQGKTHLQTEINRLVRIIAAIGITAAVVVTSVYGITRGGWLEGALAGIATAMSALPEEFPVVLTIFLALGAWRMSQNRVLARRSAAIEFLGQATVVCVDKTGTLTMNSMTVSDLVAGGEAHTIDGLPLPDRFHALAEHAALATPVDPFDPMDRAFRELETAHLTGTEHVHDDWTLVREYPLSPALLAVCNAWTAPGTDSVVIAAKGAPEAIAELCRLDEEGRASMIADVESVTSRGRRVLAVARAHVESAGGVPQSPRDIRFEFLGLAGLVDRIRPGVPAAVAECTRAGVRTVMITGDYPGTALAVAREIGLDHGSGCVTGGELDRMSDDELAERIGGISVFARMVPEQKLRLIRAFRRNGDVVAMTGDGVNDAPALKAAHIGIAMGGRGTDVAREAAALVITDDDFTSIVSGIRQGRGIFDNLRKALTYLVSVHFVIICMSVLPLFVPDWPLVLLPVQIAFLELIIDPTCSIVFEMEQADPQVMDRPPRAPQSSMFDRQTLTIATMLGASTLTTVAGVYLWAVTSGLDDDRVRSVTFAALLLSNIGLLLVNRSWHLPVLRATVERRNPAVKWIVAFALSMLTVLLFVPGARRAFDFGPVTFGDAVIATAAGFLAVSWFEIRKIVLSRR